tara:strand:- start:626 stop:727 length:102 start_codon:yes stop_codon:yes gene_type:complete
MNIGEILDELSAQLTEQLEKEHIRIKEHDEKHS